MASDSVLGSGRHLVAAGSNRGIFADTPSLQLSGVLPVKGADMVVGIFT